MLYDFHISPNSEILTLIWVCGEGGGVILPSPVDFSLNNWETVKAFNSGILQHSKTFY